MNHYLKVIKDGVVVYVMHVKSNIDTLLSIIDGILEAKYQYETICETTYSILKDRLKIKHYAYAVES